MAIDVFVDADSGSDSNGGTAWGDAYLHLQKAIDGITAVINTAYTIHLKSGCTNSYTGDVKINGITCIGKDAGLFIEPEIWTQDNYEEANGDPFNATPGAGTFDIKADDKPVVLEMDIQVMNTKSVMFRGMEFKGILMAMIGSCFVNYSRFSSGDAKAFANYMGMIGIENCYFFRNAQAIIAMYDSSVALSGDNYIIDPVLYGIWASVESIVFIAPWDDHPLDYFTTEIKTTTPRQKEYCAIKLAINSRMTIKDQDVNPSDLSIAQVNVINDYAKLGEKYYGVMLESRSMLCGADNMAFTTKNAKGEYEDMPEANRVLGKSEAGVVLID